MPRSPVVSFAAGLNRRGLPLPTSEELTMYSGDEEYGDDITSGAAPCWYCGSEWDCDCDTTIEAAGEDDEWEGSR